MSLTKEQKEQKKIQDECDHYVQVEDVDSRSEWTEETGKCEKCGGYFSRTTSHGLDGSSETSAWEGEF